MPDKRGISMLSIYFGKMEEAIYDTSTYFKHVYKDSWITSPLSVEMIKDIDRSTVISAGVIDSPALGSITPLQLSGGVKTLMLINYEKNKIFNASKCGDNCAKWILEIAKDRKVVINLRHLMDFGKDTFRIKVLNTGRIAHNMRELVEVAGLYV